MILNVILTCVAVLAATLICFGCSMSPWWLLALIPAGFIGAIVAYLLILFIISFFMPRKTPKRSSSICHWLVVQTMQLIMPFLGIRAKVVGAEQIPSCPCVIVSNHRSGFDPMTMLAALKGRRVTYISKESNFRIPLVGPYIRRAGFVPIDRGNGLRAVKSLHTAADYMKTDGIDLGIYPEGTRSKTGKLLRFKTGACYLAKLAEAPIVVLATRGTERISTRFLLSPICVELKVVEVIDAERVMNTDQNELTSYIRQVIARELGEPVEE